jgi:hypothetical protein
MILSRSEHFTALLQKSVWNYLPVHVKNSVILHYIVFGGDLVSIQVSIHCVKSVKLIIHKITVKGVGGK